MKFFRRLFCSRRSARYDLSMTVGHRRRNTGHQDFVEGSSSRRRRGGRQSNNSTAMTYESFPYSSSSNSGGDEYDFGFGLTSPLPREFQVIHDTTVPLLQNNDDTTKDFVIIAEFSELEGPIPLCTIPPNAADKTDIKLNPFSVHLMSTDYQVNTIGQFKICDDTQVLRKNVFKGVHVFMQYFTLYDIKARGFVRPFCFGYVSKDHVKLDKILSKLIFRFDKMAKVLKQGNRAWFAGELKQYLDKLSRAKESFINELTPTPKVNEDGTIFSFESQAEAGGDPDVITLDQIANQYSEIENILRIVVAADDSRLEQELFNLSEFLNRSDCNHTLLQTLKSLKIGYGPDAVQESIDGIKLPLVHPLKAKGETLRPLTTLGQLGSIHLVWKLMEVYDSFKEDTIFLEYNQLNSDFVMHCAQNSLTGNVNGVSKKDSADEMSSSQSSAVLEVSPSEAKFIMDHTVSIVLEKIHAAVPLPGGSDTKSGSSYHTVSEENSDSLQPSPPQDEAVVPESNPAEAEAAEVPKRAESPQPCSSSSLKPCNLPVTQEEYDPSRVDDIIVLPNVESPTSSTGISDMTVISSVPNTSSSSNLSQFSIISPSKDFSPCSSFSILPSKNVSPDSSNNSKSNNKSSPPGRYSLSSNTSEEETLPTVQRATPASSSVELESFEELIKKRPWWTYATNTESGNGLSRGQPGYGLLNFFRHFHKIAHHTLYSILLGRPIIICGKVDQKPRISRILNALIPLVPSLNDWKILKWHQGILVHEHIQEFKLIGLCIPERMFIQDLVRPEDENFVTIINVEKKNILGPAYSGDFLKLFESSHLIQKNFYKSDATMLSYIGSIYATIESKLYMYKSLEDKKTKKVNLKQISIRGSDGEILKHLSKLIPSPDDSLNIF